ncbi:MAG: heavy-metal-associated domain-containing protein [Pirellulales bacterium]|nr:heavy-metal-associated domain-containing protein [Pirellulales bacterium]
MRITAYVLAALAAVGMMVAIINLPDHAAQQTPSSSTAKSASDTSAPATSTPASEVLDEPGTLVLSVPKMHCEFSCYPSVKKILEGDQAVESVQLAEQKEAGTLDNRQVIVKYDAGFDIGAAIASLGEKGFPETEVVP